MGQQKAERTRHTLWRNQSPEQRNERQVQLSRHAGARSAAAPAPHPLPGAFREARLSILPPGLLQLVHHEELLFRWRQRRLHFVGVGRFQPVHVEDSQGRK